MIHNRHKHRIVSTLTLFSTFSTLLCCALPALLVALGAGAAMAGIVSNVPQLTIVSHHKMAVFGFAGAMLSLSALMQWRNRYAACPADPAKAEACLQLRKYSLIVFGISLASYFTGLFFAFVAPYLATHKIMPM